MGAGISFYEGIQHLLYPNPIENPGMNYIIITAALVFEGVSWLISIGEFKRSKRSRIGFLQAIRKGKDPSLFLIVMEDSAAMLGLLAALAGIYLTQVTGSPLFDGAASVLISFILGVTAILLARETKGLLIGEAADVETVRTIKKILINGEHVDHLNEVLTLHMGPDFVVATVSLHFVDHMSAVDVERTVVELEDAIKKRVPEVKKVFIEAEAWNRSKRNTV